VAASVAANVAVSAAAAAADAGASAAAHVRATPAPAAEGTAATSDPGERQGATLAVAAADCMEGGGGSGAGGQVCKNKRGWRPTARARQWAKKHGGPLGVQDPG
jgi:hypothetical protein